MNAAMAVPGNTAATFLVHFFGSGLADEKYVVERFKAHADGDIRPWTGETPAKGKGRRAKRVRKRDLDALRRVVLTPDAPSGTANSPAGSPEPAPAGRLTNRAKKIFSRSFADRRSLAAPGV